MTTYGVGALPTSHPRLPGARLDHIGVAVRDLDEVGVALSLLGLRPSAPDEAVPEQGVLVRTLAAGDILIELLAPINTSGPVARFLEKRGPGLHHLAFRVADVAAEVERLSAQGARFVDPQPRAGIHGTRVVFLHPSFGGGTLIELVEHPRH